MTTVGPQNDALNRRILTPRPAASISHTQLIRHLLTVMTYLALFRATNMDYGYPTYQAELGQVDYGLATALNYILAALGLLYLAVDAPFVMRAVLKSPILVIGLLLLLLTVIGSTERTDSVKGFATVFFISLPVVAFATRFGREPTFDLFRHFCIGMIFLNLVYLAAFPQFAIMGGGQGARGLFVHKNGFGPAMAVACVAVFPNWWRFDIGNIIAAVAAVLAFGFVLISLAAAAYVMLASAPFLYMGLKFVLRMQHKNTRSILVVTFVLFSVSAAAFGYLYLFEVVLEALGKDPTLTGRTKMWEVLLETASAHPFFGHGFGVFSQPAAFLPFQGAFREAFGWGASSTHNSYIEILLNCGYVVAIYWGLVILRLTWKNLTGFRGNSTVIKQQIVTVMVFVSSFSEAGRFFAATFFWLSLIIAVIPPDDSEKAGAATRTR